MLVVPTHKTMVTNSSRVARVALAAVLISAPTISVAQTVAYQRAEPLLTWNALRNVTGDQVGPTWYQDSTRFWYRVMTPRGPGRSSAPRPATASPRLPV